MLSNHLPDSCQRPTHGEHGITTISNKHFSSSHAWRLPAGSEGDFCQCVLASAQHHFMQQQKV
jgi:hypothetical protein